MNDNLQQLTIAAAEALRPPPMMTVSEWATRHRLLRKDYAKEPGLWRMERTPYLVEPMNRLSIQDPCLEVVTVFPSQTGKTTISENWLGYIADVAPGPCMFVQPTDDDCADWVDSRIQPMIEDCPSLVAKFDKPNDPEGVATKLKKGFRGGTVYFKGTNSSSKSRSKSIRFLDLDEIDAFKTAVARDGNPVKLFVARTTTYGRQAKIHYSSTPTEEATSRIWQEYLASDQHRFWVVLPCCETRQQLEFKHLRPPHKSPTGQATYQCPHCGTFIEEHTKNEFLKTGLWAPWIEQEDERQIILDLIAEEDGVEISETAWEIVHHPRWVQQASRTGGRRMGYHLNGLYSPYGWLSWQTIWQEFEAAQGDPENLQVWVNTRMAEVWRGMQGDRVDEGNLAKLCIPYPRTVPDEVGLLTGAIDIQDDRLEVLIAGWGRFNAPWHIDHRVIYGDPEDDDVWTEADRMLLAEYEGLRVSAACIDTGGHHTDKAYLFCKPRFRRRVFAVKGSSNSKDPVWPIRATMIKRLAINLFVIGVHKAKYTLFQRLQKLAGEPGCFHFPKSWDEDYQREYFAQLTAEQLIRYRKAGDWEQRFDKIRERNEVLDLWTYAYAACVALRHFGVNPEHEQARRLEPPSTTPPTKRQNEFSERRRGWF